MNLDAFFAALYDADDIDKKLDVIADFKVGGRFDSQVEIVLLPTELTTVVPDVVEPPQDPRIAPPDISGIKIVDNTTIEQVFLDGKAAFDSVDQEPIDIPPFLEQSAPTIEPVATDTQPAVLPDHIV